MGDFDPPRNGALRTVENDNTSSAALTVVEDDTEDTVLDVDGHLIHESAVDALEAELLTSADLDTIDPLQPVIEDLLYLDTLSRINGSSGCGKTFLGLDLAGSVGTGMSWHGHKATQGVVVYIVAEGARGVRKRVRAWELYHHTTMNNVRFLPRPVQATTSEWFALIEVCRRLKPSLIIIDTQARVTVGVEENSTKEMGEIVHHMESMRRNTGACVLLIHHLGLHGEHGRGSTAVKGALQTEMTMEKDKDGVIVLKNTKQKDDDELGDITFTLHSVTLPGEVDTHGWPVRSVVLQAASGQQAVKSTAAEAILAAVRDIGGGTKAEICSVVVTDRRQAGKSHFYETFTQLTDAGRLVIQKDARKGQNVFKAAS